MRDQETFAPTIRGIFYSYLIRVNRSIRVIRGLFLFLHFLFALLVRYELFRLKGFLTYKDTVFPKTHVIEDLISICKEIDKDFEILEPIIGDLSDYAVEIRYPDDWFVPSHEDTLEAYENAKKIKEFVLSKIPDL